MSTAPVLHVESLAFAYGPRTVLHGVGLEVSQGETLAVLGPNGCGKSTLLALLRGALVPTGGEVRLFGRPPHGMGRGEVARAVAVVPQMVSAAFGYTVREFVAMARYARLGALGSTGRADRAAVEKALAVTGAVGLAHRPVTELSGGELQRVALARAIAQEAPVLLLDEVTSHLDLDYTAEVAGLLLRLQREEGTTVIQVSHDLSLAAATCQRLLLLDRSGGVAGLGAPGEVLTPELLSTVFRARLAVERSPQTGQLRVFPALGHGGATGAAPEEDSRPGARP